MSSTSPDVSDTGPAGLEKRLGLMALPPELVHAQETIEGLQAAIPSPATHAILLPLKAGETVCQTPFAP